jgi:hypothetical protein
MHSSSAALRYFPPLWFLGIYESVLAGAARLPVFAQLARTGCWATAAAVLVAAATYPLAYRRRTREAIEGLGSRYEKNRFGEPLRWLLHATVLGSSSRRAVFHFIGQTLRIPRHRIYLSMYAGLGIALMVACSAVLQVEHGHLRFSVAPYGLRLAVPGVAFWTVAGLCTSLDSPADAGAGWVFRLIDDRPTQDQRDAVLIWVTLWATAITLAAVALLGWMDSSALRTPWQIIGTILMVTGLCVLLTDAFLLQSKTIPFTESRIPLNTDLAFVVLRYIVLFPCAVWIAMQWEPWIQSGPVPLAVTAIAIAALHQGLRQVNLQLAAGRLIRPEIDPQHRLIHTLGLRE